MAEISATRWLQVSPLLDELLEAHEATRALRLEQIRRDDAALAMQLETLLDQRTSMARDAFLEGTAFSVQDEPSLTGQTLGAYTLGEPIGHGGMGSVWRAERSDGRYQATVAVKFLNLALLGRGGAERFAREGDLLARLSHPNIARLLDAGVAASNQPYLVLEYIDGQPIDVWCDARSLGIEARVRLFLDVLAAVAHAHSNLILHRDLKPSNILVTPQGQVKLLDFGIGKLIADQSGTAPPTDLTQLAGRAFTPDFAAPEQVTHGDVTTATDVYALGVLLYLLLVGRHPTAQPAATQVDRLRAVVEAEPQRPADAIARNPANAAAADLRSTTVPRLVRAVRGDLDNIVAKALKKLPAERYPTVSALADDLRRHLVHEPISARRDAVAYRVAKFVRRYRVAVSVAALTILILIAGILGTAWQASEAQKQRDTALLQLQRAQAQARLNEFLFTDAPQPERLSEIAPMMQRAQKWAESLYANEPALLAEVIGGLAKRYAELGSATLALPLYRRAYELTRQISDVNLRAAAACNYADVLRINLDFSARVRALIDDALIELSRNGGQPEEHANCLMVSTWLYGVTDQYQQSVAAATQAVEIASRLPPRHRNVQAAAYQALGDAHSRGRYFATAHVSYQTALELTDAIGGGESAARGRSAGQAAMNLAAAGVPMRALPYFVRHAEESRASGRPISKFVVSVHGTTLASVGRAAEGAALHRDALASERLQDSPGLMIGLMLQAGRSHLAAGDLATAQTLMEELDRRVAVAPKPPLASLNVLHGELALAQGRPAIAVERLRAGAVLFARSTDVSAQLQRSIALATMSDAQRLVGDIPGATATAREALSLASSLQSRLFEVSIYAGLAELALGEAFLEGGARSEAQAALERAVVQFEGSVGSEAPQLKKAQAALQRSMR